MNLRNKATGEIGIFVGVMTDEISQIILSVIINGKLMRYDYHTLGQLYAEWEDYEPSMSQIENEVVRKIIRAWAEVCEVKKVEFYCYGEESEFMDKRGTDASISFNFPLKLEERRTYTIPELCGEEEE